MFMSYNILSLKKLRSSYGHTDKYFNNQTLPFIARYKGEVIGYIIGVPIEKFEGESWGRYDKNLGKNNTIYTYAYIINKKYRKMGGYSKTLKKKVNLLFSVKL